MTFVSGIGSALSTLTGIGGGSSSSGGATGAPQLVPARGHVAAFSTTFHNALASVVADANSGKYDDPDLAARITALRQRLTGGATSGTGQAQQGAGTLGGGAGAPAGSGGAHAAPDTSVTGGAGAAPTAATAGPAEARQLLVLEEQQAQARLARVHQSLGARYTAAASLPSAASGLVDYAKFRPRTRAEATAVAQRLAIDVTEGQATLEVVAGQLAVARHDAESGHATPAQVAQLQQQFDRQQQFVQKLASVVERNSGQSIHRNVPTASGGQTMENLQDAAAGSADPAAVDVQMLGKLDTMVADEAKTGHSQYVDTVQHGMQQTMINWIFEQDRRMEAHHREVADAEEKRAEQDRVAQQHQSDSQQRNQYAQRAIADRVASDQQAQQVAASRRAEFMQQLQARYQKAG